MTGLGKAGIGRRMGLLVQGKGERYDGWKGLWEVLGVGELA